MNPLRRILLPMEPLRRLLECRKLAVSGAIQLLMKNGIVFDLGFVPHTGRAREFKFTAEEGKDYQRVTAAGERPICNGDNPAAAV